jgi:hypothetical protein
MGALYSSHPLDDPAVYDDDVVMHFSDQDYQAYYRPLNSLDDSTDMSGNCATAVPGFGHNEMYPCFDSHVTYGLAVAGLNVSGPLLPVSLATAGAAGEPNVRVGAPAVPLTGTVTVSGLTSGAPYILFRYNGTDTLPSGPAFAPGAFQARTPFTAAGDTWTFVDPLPFSSDSATYYLAVPGK